MRGAAAHLLSSLADRSRVWVGLAAVRAAIDRPQGPRAAARALGAVAVQSAVVHWGVKPISGRRRPESDQPLRFGARRPASSSFPSGHAASAATAAILLSDGWRGTRIPLVALAGAVSWSRVRTGLHHPSDVVAGFVLGVATGLGVQRLLPLELTPVGSSGATSATLGS